MYSIRWAHQLAGLDPLRLETVRKIAQRYSASNRLAEIRFLAILLICDAGCFRIGEILAFTMDAFEITSDCMLIYFNKRKNDQCFLVRRCGLVKGCFVR